VVQSALIAVLWQQVGPAGADPAAVRSYPPVTAGAPLLAVRLRSSAAEGDVRRLMLAIDARIVDGPSQLGDYVVSVPADRLASARQALVDSPLVESVALHR
jgi:hypothetical protein